MTQRQAGVARQPGCQFRRVLPTALVGAALAGSVSAQGIYPGELPKDGYKLPGGFEPVLHLRTYYFDQDSTSSAESEAWALGGWAGVRSPWWWNMVQVGLVVYTSQELYGPDSKGGARLLTATQEPITVIGEAFGALRYADQTFTAYRQLINRPFVNPQDNRMIPNTFEAYTLTGAAGPLSYIGGYITRAKLRDTDSFRWVSDIAGGSGDHRGMAFVGGTYAFGKSGYVRIDDQFVLDVYNTFYADLRYPIPIDDKTSVVLGGQYYAQYSVGEQQIGDFSTWGAGLQAAVTRGPLGVQLYLTQTGKGRDTLNPYGNHASYLDLMQVAFNTAGEKAWAIGGSIDFAAIGAPGLTAAVVYAAGRHRIDARTRAPVADRDETDARIDYAFPKGSVLEGLSATLRYSWLHQDGAPQTGTQLRAYLNYAVRF